ncbi:MAG TPA: hypothetical protein VKT81_13765 [Bryobacteraceae bacterium]|nr:hypothetical protein [Bryobacteraceae bacterium]
MPTSPQILLQGTITVGEVTRFQYFHTLRRLWPFTVVAALFLVFTIPLGVFVMVSGVDPGWRQILTNSIPFLVWLVF